MLLILISILSGFAFTGTSSSYSISSNFNSGISNNLSMSSIAGTGYSTNFFIRLGSQSYNVTHLLEKPQITITVPVDSSFINVTQRSVLFEANFSKEIKSLILVNQDNKVINLTNELTGDNDISTIIPINAIMITPENTRSKE